MYPAALLLFFVAAFGLLFYELYQGSIAFEKEKNHHDLDLLSSSLQSILLSDEGFFMARLRETSVISALQRECQEYIRLHPELVSAEAQGDDGAVQWEVTKVPSPDTSLRLAGGAKGFVLCMDTSRMICYSKPYSSNEKYYFAANYSARSKGSTNGSCTVFYSAEELLKEILRLHPMEGYEITLFAGAGEAIASTGYSNAPAAFRFQRAVPGYGPLLSVDIADPQYSFWSSDMIVLALVCGLLSAAVFGITFALQRDVGRLEKAQSSLRSSEERFRTMFESSSDAIRLTDRYGRIVMANSAYCDLIKTSREELLRDFNAGDDNLDNLSAANSAFRAQFDAGTLKMPSSQSIKRRGGEDVPVEVSHSFINAGKGEKLLLSVFRDVSERHKLELESQQVQRMDALGEFAIGIGNSLKNIFGIVLNSAEMMSKEASKDVHFSSYVEMIMRESQRASELADDLLVFARSKSVESKPVLAEKVIHQAHKILEHSLPPSITLSVFANDSHAVINGDIHQLHQAIVNVALAARQRMPNGGSLTIGTSVADPEIVRSRFPSSQETEFIAVTVSDNGNEIDEFSRRRIFEPFFNARATDFGTGLRLSVAYGIVQQHGGFIEMESGREKGTTIVLYFPVAYHETPEAAKSQIEEPHGGGECILVVDDEESYRQIYEYGLKSLGYRVYTARDGEDALSIYNAHRSEIDLVLSDLLMPKMNGEELLTTLLGTNPALKVILATGAIDLKARTEFRKLGISDIIMKPFLFDELTLSVRKVLDAR